MQSGVRRWAVAVDVYARIRDDIVSGVLGPGSPLVFGRRAGSLA